MSSTGCSGTPGCYPGRKLQEVAGLAGHVHSSEIPMVAALARMSSQMESRGWAGLSGLDA